MKAGYIFLFVFFYFQSCSVSLGRAGIAEIFFSTPGGHTICHCDPYSDEETPALIGFDKLVDLNKWYFYRNHIVGAGNNFYFILNEENDSLQYFQDKNKWEEVIQKQSLKPFLTRWLDLSDSPDQFLFYITITSVFSIPLVLIFITILFLLFFRKKIKLQTLGYFLSVFLLIVFLFLFFNLNLTSF